MAVDIEVLKAVAGLVGFGIGFFAFVSYAHQVRLGKCRPHPVSWLIWSFAAVVGMLIQFNNGAGWAVLPVLSTAVGCLLVISQTDRKTWQGFTPKDWINLAIALGALIGWYLIDQPEVAVVMLSVGTFIAFATTAHKVYRIPFEEQLSIYVISACKQVVGAAAVTSYSFVTIYSFSFAMVMNVAVALLIFVKRRQLMPAKKSDLVLAGP